MQVSLISIVLCATLALVVGSIWYGPLFGKQWMQLIGAKSMDIAERKEMQKKVMPLYIIQFILVLFQAYVLAQYITGWQTMSGIGHGLWIWAAFVMPTVASTSMWNNDSRKNTLKRFLIQAGYQLVIFVLFGLLLG